MARRASSYPASSSQVPYTDPMILEQLQNKDERIEALEEQNATILSENSTILTQLESQKKTNAKIIMPRPPTANGPPTPALSARGPHPF